MLLWKSAYRYSCNHKVENDKHIIIIILIIFQQLIEILVLERIALSLISVYPL